MPSTPPACALNCSQTSLLHEVAHTLFSSQSELAWLHSKLALFSVVFPCMWWAECLATLPTQGHPAIENHQADHLHQTLEEACTIMIWLCTFYAEQRQVHALIWPYPDCQGIVWLALADFRNNIKCKGRVYTVNRSLAVLADECLGITQLCQTNLSLGGVFIGTLKVLYIVSLCSLLPLLRS